MNATKNYRSSMRRWRGVTTFSASVLAFAVAAGPIINSFRTDIDKFAGTSSTKLVHDDGGDLSGAYTYASDYSSTTELLNAIEDLGERMNEEGSVLLKNNGALPLSKEETQKVSLLGFSSYYPVMGGEMSSDLSENVGTDADTVDFVQALSAKGFKINEGLQDLYRTLEPQYTTEIDNRGMKSLYKRNTPPAIDGTYSSKEPSRQEMDDADAEWTDYLKESNVILVTLARGAGENRSYLPGTDGVDASQDLNQTDPLGLSDDERSLIAAATESKKANGGKVIVLLNSANAMEIDELKNNDDIDAILQIGLPGGYGFYGVADILSGATNPSGHLADTYAVANANAPSAQNYGNYPYTNNNANLVYYVNGTLVEAENIYIGYKYYETRYMDCVLGQGNASAAAGSTGGAAWNYDNEVSYPFGYGLSYTTFEQTLDSLDVDPGNKTVTAQVTVTNTGDIAGKDVVQLYVSTPYTAYDREHGVEKAGVQLLDYAKTGTLEAGASETVTIKADMQYMTSWDSSSDNAAGTKGCYILDAGTYYFSLGNGAHEAANNVLAAQGKGIADGMTEAGDAALTAAWSLESLDAASFALTKNGTPVENQLEDLDLNYWMPGTVTYMSRSDWAGTFPKTYENLAATEEMLACLDNDTYEISADNGDPSGVVFGADNGLTLADMKGVDDIGNPDYDKLIDQITLEECMIRTGFGGTSTKPIDSIRSPEAVQNDGLNGIYSYPLGQYANTDASTGDPCAIDPNDPNLKYTAGVMSNATVVGQTFNKELSKEFGEVMGNYSLWSNLTIWWGCGTNLHRSQYNARNHDYYSEDPVLTAYQGANLVRGGLAYGCLIAPKHFAFNDTEINRRGISVFMTEQQARENELRGTQAAVEDAGALALMSSFNRVGVRNDNSHTGLLSNILRGEWGFEGLLSEDYIMSPSYTSLKEAVMNGVTMSANTGDNTMKAVSEKYPYWTVKNVSRDAALLAALKQAMKYQAFALANSNAMDGYTPATHVISVRTSYDNFILGLRIVFGLLVFLGAAMYLRSDRKRRRQTDVCREDS